MNLSCWDDFGSQHIHCRFGMAVGFWWQADLWKYVKQIFNKKVNFEVIWFVFPLKSVEFSILRLSYGAQVVSHRFMYFHLNLKVLRQRLLMTSTDLSLQSEGRPDV